MSRWMKWMFAVAVLLSTFPMPAEGQSSRSAGKISALIPVDHVVRGRARLDAVRDMPLFWGDVIETQRGGRVRVRLDDGSILNVGSQSQLRIEQHDSQAQRTGLQLAYGRMRASVVRIAQPGGGFTVRGSTAVAGVVGTDVYTDSQVFYMTIIALGGGLVTAQSLNPNFPEPIILNPGEAVTIVADQRGQKRLATEEELSNAFTETEVGEVVSVAPARVAPGQTVQAIISGTELLGATGISFERAGITASITGEITANQIPVSITVGADVPLGTYPFTVNLPTGEKTGVLVVTTEENARAAAAQAIQPPEIAALTAIRGAKFVLDATGTRTPPGTQITNYLWQVLETELSSDEAQFRINTSLLPPGEYKIELVVVNNRGQSVRARYALTVLPGIQPQEIVRDLATAYESLQPTQFLKHFSEERFRNYAGFAAAIEDSFRNQLETARVFQRPVNCSISEENDQAVCQADYEVQFTKKDQPLELLDSEGNPFPPGVVAPAGTPLTKRILKGTERASIRFERADKGWQIVDYAAEVSCPGGSAATGVNVGSCILAIGTFSTPGFQLLNLSLPVTDLFLGGTVTGSFDVAPVGGFNGNIDFTATASVLGTPVQVTFTPNPAPSLGRVDFTVSSPSTVPVGFTGADPFTVQVTGTDTTGTVTQSLTFGLTLKGDFTLVVTPATSPTSPLTTAQGATLTLSVQVVPGTGFTGSVLLDFANLPAGITPINTNITVPAGGTAVMTASVTQGAAIGPATFDVKGSFGNLIKTAPVFVDISALPPFSVAQFSTPTGPLTLLANSSVVLGITVAQNIPGFTQPVTLTFGPLPQGVTVTPTSAVVNPGSTQNFTFTFVPAGNPVSNFGTTNITVTGTATGLPPQTNIIVLNLSSAASLPFTISAGGTSFFDLPNTTTGSFSVAVSSATTFNQPINISVGPTPAGVSISPSTFVFTPGLSGSFVTYSINVNPSLAVPGTYPISISAVSGGVSSTTTRTLVIRGSYTISISPDSTTNPPSNPIVIPPDGTTATNITVTINAQNGFAGTVNVTFSSPFTAAAVAVTPATTQSVTVPANGTAQVTFTLIGQVGASNTGALSSFVSTSSPSGSQTNSPSGPALSIGPAGFTLSAASTSVTLNISSTSTTSTSVSVIPLGNFSGSVDFTVVPATVPPGVTISPATQTVVRNGTATFNLIAATPATSGTGTITVNAVSGSITQTFTIQLRLRGSLSINVTQSPGGGPPGTQTVPLVLAPGGSLSFTVSVGSLNGFTGTATLQVFGLPSGVTAAWSATGGPTGNVSVPGSDTVTLTAGTTIPSIVLQQITFQASDLSGFSSNTATQAGFLTTGTPSFTLQCDFFGSAVSCPSFYYLSMDINTGQQSSLSLRVTSSGGYNGTVSVTPQGLPAGVTMSPNPLILSPGQPSTVFFTASTPATAGTFNATLVATDTQNPALTSSQTISGQLNGSVKLVPTPASSFQSPLVIAPGSQQTIVVDVSGQNGFSGTVDVDAFVSFAQGVSITPSTTQTVVVPPTGSVQVSFTLDVAPGSPPSNILSISFFATGFDATFTSVTYFVSGETQVDSFYVVGPSTFNVSVSGAVLNNPLFLPVGQQRSMFITVSPIGNFSGTVDIDVVGLPSSILISSAPGSSATIPVQQGIAPLVIQPAVTGVNASGSSVSTTIFFTALPTAPRGFIQATLTATSGSITQTIPIALFVVPQLSLTLTPASTSTAPLTIAPGSNAQLQIAVNATPAFPGMADITFSSLPTGFSVTPNSTQVSLGGFSTVTVDVASSVTPSTQLSFNVNASINGFTLASAPVNIFTGAGAFSLNITPASALSSATPLVINPGASGNVSVQVNAIGGFTGSVTVSTSFSISSLSTPTTQQTVGPGQTANFTVNAAANAQGLIGRMFISATSGNQSASATVFISVGSGGFSLTASPGGSSTIPVTLDVNNSTSFNVLIHQQAGFSGTVSLSVTGLPAGVTVLNNNVSAPAGTSQTFQLQASSSALAGDYPFTLTGSAPGLPNVVVNMFLRIRSGFSLAITPGANPNSPLVLAPGSQQTFTVSVIPASAGNFFGSVQISFFSFQLPTGVTITPSSATADPNTPATFTIDAASGVQLPSVQSVQFNASGTYTSSFPSVDLYYSVASGATFNVSFSSPVTMFINSSANAMTVDITPVGGYSGTVTVNVTNVPAGIVVSPLSVSLPVSGFGNSVTLNFQATSAAIPGLATAQLTVTDGTITVGPQNIDLVSSADFSMSATPPTTSRAPILLTAGGSANVTIDVTPLNNFQSCPGGPLVNLNLPSTPPAGVTVTFPPQITAGTPATMTVSVQAGTPASQVFGITLEGAANDPNCALNLRSVTSFFVIGPGSFSISPPSFATSVSIGSGSLSSVSVPINSIGNFTGTVTVTVTPGSVPAGVLVTPATAVVNAGTNHTFQVRADPPATSGTAQFSFTVTDGTTTLNGTIPLLLRGSYSLSISPANSSSAPAVVAPGQTVTYTVTVNPFNGFNGTVDISRNCFFCGSPPPGVTVTSSLQASPSSPGQIVVSANNTALPTSPFSMLFLTSSPDSFSSPSFSFFAAGGPPVFNVTNTTSVQNPRSVVINGSTRTISVTVQSLGAFSGTVDLALGTLPPGITASPQTAQVFVPAGGSVSFNFVFSAATGAVQGPVDVVLTATQGTQQDNSFIYLYVVSNMALQTTPATSPGNELRLFAGDPVGQTISVTVISQGGFTGSITLTPTNVPSFLTITPTPNPPIIPAGGSATLQITAAAGAPSGLTSFNIDAQFAGLFASTTVFLNVGVGSYTFTLTPASTPTNPIVIDPNGTTQVPLTAIITPQNGFVGTVTVAPAGTLPPGLTFTPPNLTLNVTSNSPVSGTFNLTATTALGPTPVQVDLDANSTVVTPSGPVNLSVRQPAQLLINPPIFALTQSAGTSGSPISLEQGIPPGQTFQIGVTGLGGFTGTVTLSFGTLPPGLVISPTTASVAAGGSATFTIDAQANSSLGSFIIPVTGTSGSQQASISLFVDIIQPTSGIFLTTSPPTSPTAPILLQPNATLVTFMNVNVNAKGSFAGTVTLTLANVPAGVTATLVPNIADLTVSPVQVVQLTFQTTTGLAPFGPVLMTVTGTSGSVTASVGVFVGLQTTSAIKNPGVSAQLAPPRVLSVQPAVGVPGSYVTLVITGESLSGISQVMSSTPSLVPRIEAGATDNELRVSLFVRPDADLGQHALMLVSPRGTVPIGFTVGEINELNDAAEPGRPRVPTRAGLRPRMPVARATDGYAGEKTGGATITRVEPASLQPGTVVEGRLLGENLKDVTAVRASGLGVTVEILDKTETEVRVRFLVAASAPSGSRLLTAEAAGARAAASLQIAPTARVPVPQRGPLAGARQFGRGDDAEAAAPAGPLDLAIRADDILMSPANPRPGETVSFRIRLSNLSAQRVENSDVEFSIAGTPVRTREKVSLEPFGSYSFQVEWQAEGSGRLEPRVVVDPDQKLADANRENNTARLPAFELVSANARAGATPASGAAAPRAIAGPRERGQISLAPGTCQGFRLTSGTEQACGGADLEVTIAAQGGAVRLEAEGIRNLGTLQLDQVSQLPSGSLATVETLQPAALYLVKTSRGTYLVRVAEVRGLESLTYSNPAFNRPRLNTLEREPGARSQARVTLVLEWRAVQP